MQGFVDAELIRDDSAWHVDQAYRGNTLHDLCQMQKQASSQPSFALYRYWPARQARMAPTASCQPT